MRRRKSGKIQQMPVNPLFGTRSKPLLKMSFTNSTPPAPGAPTKSWFARIDRGKFLGVLAVIVLFIAVIIIVPALGIFLAKILAGAFKVIALGARFLVFFALLGLIAFLASLVIKKT